VNFTTASLRDPNILRVLQAAFDAADPARAVQNFLRDHPLPRADRVFVFGLGKASLSMARSLTDLPRPTDSLLIAKHASPLDNWPGEVLSGDHPIPGPASLAAAQAARNFLSRLTPDDLLLCLISGGGSALLAAPIIPLEELQSLTSHLLASGATIDEINTIRRHLDSLKGGGLAQLANGARILSLILSDVVGDALHTIASGPTAPDPTTIEDAARVVGRISNPPHAGRISNSTYKFRETIKPGDPIFTRVRNHIIASNDLALRAAKEQAEVEGFHAEIIESGLQGEAREIGKRLAEQLKEAGVNRPRPFCLLAGGETTVTLRGEGRGGRNQELALGAVDALRGVENVLLISIATDGEDGPSDAAGAVVTGETAARAESLGMSAPDYLSRNDAYSFFEGLGDLVKTGPSGTNVNDVVLMVGF
jgi:hydroxypyruvate reductase